jgi:hypothetical protein
LQQAACGRLFYWRNGVMKRLLLCAFVFGALVFGGFASAQTSPLKVDLAWSNPSCSATVSTNTSGQQTAGPCLAQVYRAAATGSCPAFSTSAYTLLSAATAQNAATGAYTDASPVVGTTYCYAVTESFVAGGAASGVSNLFQIAVILSGSPAIPTGLHGSVVAAGN